MSNIFYYLKVSLKYNIPANSPQQVGIWDEAHTFPNIIGHREDNINDEQHNADKFSSGDNPERTIHKNRKSPETEAK
jgi:hypothetical protein